MPTILDSGAYLLGVRPGETEEVGVPLPWEQGLLRCIAILAGRHDIAADRLASANQRHDVVERKASRTDVAPAVVTAAIGDPSLPPSGPAKLARERLFTPEARRVALWHEPVRHAHVPSVAAASCSDSSSHSFMSHATFCSASLRAWAISRARSPSR